MAEDIELTPDKYKMEQALRGGRVLSPMEFYQIMSPETFKGYEPADQLDRLMNSAGIVTPKIKHLRDAHKEIDTTLQPLYGKYKSFMLEQTLGNATVGEAQSMFPGFPTPPGAMESFNVPAQGPGAPRTIEGDQPMAQSLTPVRRIEQAQGPFDIRQGPGENDPIREIYPYTSRMDIVPSGVNTSAQGPGAPMTLEGPQPTGTAQRVNPNALLPRSYQHLLEQRQDRERLQRPAPHYPSAEEQKLNIGVDLGIRAFEFKHGRKPNPEELNTIYTEVTGGFDKAPKPGSLGERKLEGEAKVSEAKGDFAQVREEADLFATGMKGKRDQADAAETWKLMGAKLEEITQRALLEKAQTSSAYQKAEAGQFNESLAAAKLYGALNKSTKLSMEDKVNLMNSVLGQQKDGSTLEVIPKQTPVEAFFGMAPSETEVKPKGLGSVPEQPTSEQSDNKQSNNAYLHSIWKSMKMGEEKVIKGKRYKKVPKGLEELN